MRLTAQQLDELRLILLEESVAISDGDDLNNIGIAVIRFLIAREHRITSRRTCDGNHQPNYGS